jgi:hypothetical protein
MNRSNLAFGAILALAIVVLGGGMAIRSLADPARITEMAQQKAREKWDKQLTVGSLQVETFPRPVLHARDVVLEGVGQVERIDAQLQLLPLIFGRVRPAHLAIEGGAFSDPKRKEFRVDHATLDSEADWRGVVLDATVSRNGQTAHLAGHFADLSRIGHRGEKTRGKLDIEWGETRIATEGDYSLDGTRGHALKASVRTGSLDDVFAFVGMDRGRTAPLEVTANVRDEDDLIHLDDMKVHLGGMHAEGEGTIDTAGDKPTLAIRLSADRFDWAKALEDMGHARKPKEESPFIFRERPLAWKTLAKLRGLRGKVEANAQWARLGNGIELQEPRAHFTFDDDRVVLDLWQAKLLGGSGRGSLGLDATRKTVHFEGNGENLLLQRWFHERGRDHHFTGGPMRVRMALDMHGDTWRDLAASVTGPFTIRMGPGRYDRQKAGDWEALMASFSKRESTGAIEFECAAATLRFDNGVARGDSIVGARSALSSLLTSGVIGMREEHVDLRGKLHPLDGKVGLAAIAEDLQIEGPLRKLHVQLDPAKKPAIVARAAAAIATLGISVATSGSHPAKADACAL